MKTHLFLAGASVVVLLSTVMIDRVNGAKSTPQKFTRGVNVIELNNCLTDGTAIKVKIKRGKIPLDYPYKSVFLLMWGANPGKSSEDVITAMNVKIGNEEISIPLSAYSDLGNPRLVSLEKTKGGFRVLIKGSDAGEAYDAVLIFEGKNIKSRKVSSSEFPDAQEETVYSFPNVE
jgi:hypothetical protein